MKQRATAERRKHPRYKINLRKSVEIEGEQVPVMDISWGGIGLFSREPHPEGGTVDFFIGGLIVRTQLLECSPIEEGGGPPEYPFRLRCRFDEKPGHPDIKALMKLVWKEEFGNEPQ
ncbi:MAG: PilZ domain-containing protein [bacterium]